MLNELNVCALAQIIPDQTETPYYYVSGNPALDFDTTCLINTTITYTPVENVIVLPPPNTLIGTFSCDTTDPVTYFFVDENGDPTTNDNFVIAGNGLYLAHEYSYYSQTDFQVNIGAIRVDTNAGRTADTTYGLNERINLQIAVNIEGALGIPNHDGENLFVLSPNPAHGFVDVQSKETLAGATLHDMLGREVRGISLSGNRIDVSAVAAGTYLLKVTTISGKSGARRLIIAP
jgi:hypothetical protein